MMAFLLDLANIIGGFLIAVALLRHLPRVGDDIRRFVAPVLAFGWIVGIVALVAGGYYLLVHAISGPHLYHFEVVGIGVGLALLWDRITGRKSPQPEERDGSRGLSLLLAVFGLIAMAVGFQGLFTSNT